MSVDGSFFSWLNSEATFWGARMLYASIGGGLFLGGVWAVCRLAPRLPATLRASLWWLALMKLGLDVCGIAPLALPLLPATSTVSAERPALTNVSHPLVFRASPTGPRGRVQAALPDDADSRLPSPIVAMHFSWPLCLQVFWMAGVVICLGRSTRQGLRLRRLVRAALPVRFPENDAALLASALRLRHVPRLLESAAVSAPCVTGGFRPVILVPSHLSELYSPEERRLALAHEMAHIRRGDLLLAWLPALVQTVFFFHPLAWLGVREWAAAREEACDAAALTVTGAAPARLGHLLLKIAGGTQSPALGLSPGYYSLRRRLGGLKALPLRTRQSRWLLAVALLGLLPWRLTAAVRPAAFTGKPSVSTLAPYAITDLGEGSEATGLNAAGQAALTLRDGSEAQGLVAAPDSRTALGALPKHHWSIAYGINAGGSVAAASYNIPGHSRAFVWDGSRHRLGSLPGYPYSQARAVNDSGQVAGFAETGGHDRWQARIARAFLWQSGDMTDLGTLGGLYSYAYGLNNQGQVVGKADTEIFGETHAFLWQNGQMQDLGTLGGANSLACRVSDSGAVVGCAEIGSGVLRHAFLWQNGAMRDLGTLPGLPDSVACGVNAQGEIVGYAEPQPESEIKHAVVWRNGAALDLNTLLPPHSGWILREARAVNDRGQIVGNGMQNGQAHAFLLTPG